MKVTMYTAEGCPPCKLAKEFLKGKGVQYEEIDVASEENFERISDIVDKEGVRAVPFFKLENGKTIKGFNKDELGKELGLEEKDEEKESEEA